MQRHATLLTHGDCYLSSTSSCEQVSSILPERRNTPSSTHLQRQRQVKSKVLVSYKIISRLVIGNQYVRYQQSMVLRTKIRLHPLSIQSAPKKECGYQTQANEMRADLSSSAFRPCHSDKVDGFDIWMVAYLLRFVVQL